MVVVGAPLLITGEMGPLMNFNNFFMCGLPGGADYAMLYAVKHAWMCAATLRPPGAWVGLRRAGLGLRRG